MADVVLGKDTLLDRWVALKRVRTANDPRALKRLRREAVVGASVSHPNLVSVYDVLEEDGDVVVVMEYVAGDTLRDVIRTRRAIRPSSALTILEGVAAALDTVHARGIVHRDVKPANILLGLDGSVKLADLGIAAVDDNTKITTTGQVLGTFSYMAPEQLEGEPPRPAMDIYAVGAVAFEALCGKKARPEANPLALAHAIATRAPPDLRDHWPQAPAAVAEVLKRAMSRDPMQRPRSAGELMGRLREALGPEPTEETVAPARRLAGVAGVADGTAMAVAPAASRRRPPDDRRRARVAAAGNPGDRGSPSLAAAATASEASNGRSTGTHPDPPSRARTRRPLLAGLALLAAVALVAVAIVAFAPEGNTDRSKTTAPTAGARHAARNRTSRGSAAQAAVPPSAVARRQSRPPRSPSHATGTASASPASASTGRTISATATPAGAVERFYEAAAQHDYVTAWNLADTNVHNQLEGFDSFRAQMSRVRVVTFHQARGVLEGPSSAAVAVDTTAVLIDKTQHCTGRVQTIRSAAGSWLLDHLSIGCVPA